MKDMSGGMMAVIDSMAMSAVDKDKLLNVTLEMPTEAVMERIKRAFESVAIKPVPRTKDEFVFTGRQIGKSRMVEIVNQFGVREQRIILDEIAVEDGEQRMARIRLAQAEWAKKKAEKDRIAAALKAQRRERERQKKRRKTNFSKDMPSWGEF